MKEIKLTGKYSNNHVTIDAARARDRKAIELLGDKAVLNFPKEDYV